MSLVNIDLRHKVRYGSEKDASDYRPVVREGRSSSGFRSPADARARAVEMDTTLGKRGDFKCTFPVHFLAIKFQIVILLKNRC